MGRVRTVAARVRTLVLSEHFLPNCGGTITWLYETYRRFAPGEILVIAGEIGDTDKVDSALPFKVERVRMRMDDWDPTQAASLWRYLAIFRHVRSSQRLCQAAQVNCMKVLPEGLIAWCLRRITGVPYLLYAHGEEIQMRLTSRKLAWLIPALYRGAAAIIANSHHTKQLLIDIGVCSERIHIVHPGVDPSGFCADESASLTVRKRYRLGDAFVLLTVGRLQRRKGQDMVIRSLPLIKQEVPNVVYLIVGSGEEEKYLRELAAMLGATDNVVFVGSISDSERAAYYGACDLFIMPNRQIDADIEGFGIVFLEAGAAGKPVIGGLSGGTADAIQEGITGLRVDGETPEAVAEAVIALAKNPKTARDMGEQGRRRIETDFSWDLVVQRTRQITDLSLKLLC
jgi:phosphatidylinositol alpha-1,6-mannosyltransferase